LSVISPTSFENLGKNGFMKCTSIVGTQIDLRDDSQIIENLVRQKQKGVSGGDGRSEFGMCSFIE
ncbi:hypothetical protein EV360DRAFT_23564, partial [Lentinula raphanica]